MLGLVAGWQGGWVGVSWQETQDKPVSSGRDGEDEGAGSPGPAPFLPHVLDLLFGELGRPCTGCLQRRVVSWLGLVNRAAVRRPFHLEADILPSDGKTEAQGTPTPSPVVPLGLKYLFWGSIGEARWGGKSTSALLSRRVHSLLVVIASAPLGGVPLVYR